MSPHYGKERFINIGLYGLPHGPVKALTQELEEKILELGGRKMLYALTYYSKEKFEKSYDIQRLESLRKMYMANGLFLPLYNKVRDVL